MGLSNVVVAVVGGVVVVVVHIGLTRSETVLAYFALNLHTVNRAFET